MLYSLRKFSNEPQRGKFLQHFFSALLLCSLTFFSAVECACFGANKTILHPNSSKDVKKRSAIFFVLYCCSRKKQANSSKPALFLLLFGLTLRYLKWIMCMLYTLCAAKYTIFGTAFQWRYSTQHSCSLSRFCPYTVPVCFFRCFRLGHRWTNALITRTKDSDAFFLFYSVLMRISCARMTSTCECNRYRIAWKIVCIAFSSGAAKKNTTYLNVWARETNCLAVPWRAV